MYNICLFLSFVLDGVQAILPVALDNVSKLNEHAHKFAFDIVFIHLKRKLHAASNLRVSWNSLLFSLIFLLFFMHLFLY